MKSSATLRHLGVSAQKTRLVVDQVRGREVGEALSLLRFSPKRVARDVERLMKSAVANAQTKHLGIDVDKLYVARAVVNEAPTVKRSRANSMGRVFRILKRACHVTIDLDLAGKRPARGGK